MADVPGSNSSTIDLPIGGTPAAGYNAIESAGDEDWYRLTLSANTTYTFRIQGRGVNDNTLVDPLILGIFSGGTYQTGFNNDGLISGPYGKDAMTTYRPTAGGTYYLAVTGDQGTTGTYTVSAANSNPGNDTNYPASTATTQVVNVGGTASGTIDSETDVDWFRVALNGGTTYTIRIRGLASGGTNTLPDPVIAGVYNSSGTYIVNTYVDDRDMREPTLTFIAPSSGNYYIAADGWNTYTGTYTVSVDTVAGAAADVLGNTGTTATLAIGTSTPVNMDQPYDHDWYAVSLTAGVTYQFTMSGTGLNNTPTMHGIFNSAGAYVGGYAAAILGAGTANSSTIFTPSVSGTYYLDTFSIYQGAYTLTAAQISDDVRGTTSTTGTVNVNGSVMGDIGGTTDIDWYKVTLVGGTTYAIKMQGKQSNMGTLEDPVIAGIYDASGKVMGNTFSDDTDGNEASVMFAPASSGTYYIAADGYAGYTGTYTLSVTTVPGDIGQTKASATSVTLNTPTLVTINDAADIDWYSVNLTGGITYGIRLLGAPTKRGTLYDPVLLGVYDSTETRIQDTFTDDARGLLDSIMWFTPASNGTYYIAADGYDRYTGTAKLFVTTDNNSAAAPGSFTTTTPAEGVIDTTSDSDRYGVWLEASTLYYVRMQGLDSRNGDLADPQITKLWNPAGTEITTGITPITDAAGADWKTVGRDHWLKFTTSATAGVYSFDVNGSTTSDGAFLLSAVKDAPDTTSTSLSIAVGESKTGMIDEGTDVDWWSVSLNLNTSYVVKMQGLYSGNGTIHDPYINGVAHSGSTATNLAGSTGTAVDNAVGRDSVARFIPTTAGTHYIKTQGSGGTFGTFLLSVYSEIGGTVNSADQNSLTVGGSVTGTIDDPTDADYYRVYLTQDTAYLFKMLGVDGGGGNLDDPLIGSIVNGSNGSVGATITSVGMDSYARWVANATGYVYINAQGAGADSGTFTLTAETEIGNTYASAGTISVATPATGRIDDGTDADYFKFTHNTSTGYIFRMSGVSSGGGSLPDPNIADIKSSGGTTQSGEVFMSSGTDSIVRWAPSSATPADYMIDAQGAGTRGTYTITMETEPGGVVGSAWTLAIGDSVTSNIDDATDTDFFKVSLSNTSSYIFKMRGVSSGGTLPDPNIPEIRGSGGAAVTGEVFSAFGTDAIVRFAPGTTDVYFIDAQGSGGTGTYILSAEAEAGSTNTNAQQITLGQTINAAIDDASDLDRYIVTLAPSTRYRISMLGGTLNDSLVSIRNGTGPLSSTEGSGKDAVLIYTTPSSGTTYYIDADNGAASSTIIGSYSIKIELWP